MNHTTTKHHHGRALIFAVVFAYQSLLIAYAQAETVSGKLHHNILQEKNVAKASQPAATKESKKASLDGEPKHVSQEFCKSTLDKLDEIVTKHFYDPTRIARWKADLAAHRNKIETSHDLIELGNNINIVLRTLNASHTQFVTRNDETYFFLQSLFHRARKEGNKTDPVPPQMDYTGAVTGGLDCKPNQVRYVLDGSPAALAGIRPGDEIETVDGEPYVGQLSFEGKANTTVLLKIRRHKDEKTSSATELMPVSVVPKKAFAADEYGDAIKKSARIDPSTSIGYIHMWTGSGDSHDIIEELLGSTLQASKSLIFDMRDGYGGAFFNDLDFFYRPPNAYPKMTIINREGKRHEMISTYDKPLVALINGGSRSGKELLSYSLKKSGRAKLVGQTTAGMVLAGRLFDINDRCALYLAVQGIEVNGEVLEGKGVAPDIEVSQSSVQRGIKDLQLEQAKKLLQ